MCILYAQPFKFPLHFDWKPVANLPFKMIGYIQSIATSETIYVGGGYTGTGRGSIVMAFNKQTQRWAELPAYDARDFALVKIDNQLAVVGGWIEVIPKPGVWNEDSKKWTHPFPEMPTPRAYCSAVVYNRWLVVAGGINVNTYRSQDLSTVEILNIDRKQWSSAPSTPVPWNSVRPALVGDTCYFMGGARDVYRVFLPSLVSHLNADKNIWVKMHTPSGRSPSPLVMKGSLFAVSGTLLYAYQYDTNEWVEAGELPVSHAHCTCVMSAEREVFFAGGNTANIAHFPAL